MEGRFISKGGTLTSIRTWGGPPPMCLCLCEMNWEGTGIWFTTCTIVFSAVDLWTIVQTLFVFTWSAPNVLPVKLRTRMEQWFRQARQCKHVYDTSFLQESEAFQKKSTTHSPALWRSLAEQILHQINRLVAVNSFSFTKFSGSGKR